MLYLLLADVVLMLHLGFVLFAVLGGLMVLRYRSVVWLHLPALCWAIIVQWRDWICPLTPLENTLRQWGGEAGYAGGFVEHVVSTILYPENLTLELRYVLGGVLLMVNAGVYAYVGLRIRWRVS
ncbi:MAG: DUF2784 domain-containing protein [Pseudomonadota bacterium]